MSGSKVMEDVVIWQAAGALEALWNVEPCNPLAAIELKKLWCLHYRGEKKT